MGINYLRKRNEHSSGQTFFSARVNMELWIDCDDCSVSMDSITAFKRKLHVREMDY